MKLKDNVKRIWALALSCVMALSLASCGGDSQADNGVSKELPEYTYVPEYIKLNVGENANLYNAQFNGDKIYYMEHKWDENTGSSSVLIHEYSVSEGKDLSSITVSENKQDSNVYRILDSFYVKGDGNMVTVETASDHTDENNVKVAHMLCEYDKDHNLLNEADLAEAAGIDNTESFYVNSFLCDEKGRMYINCSDNILLFDENMKYAGKIDTQAAGMWINSAGVAKDGNVYASMYDEGTNGNVLKQVDFDKKAFGAEYANFPNGNGDLAPGMDGDFLVNDGTRVCEYSLETQSSEELFLWLDSDIFGDYVQNMSVADDGRIIVTINDWESGDTEIAYLTKKKTSELPQKTQITIGSIYSDQSIQSAAVAFNKQSDKYHVTIKYYMDNSSYDENSYTDAQNALNNDLISSGAPDIVDVSQVNVSKLAAKGAFEDINSWLDKSAALNKDDYMENVLTGCTFDGKLIYIPKTFSIITVVGKTSDVGEKRGWSLEDVMALSKANPDSAIFEGWTKETMINYMMLFNQERFIDYSTGKCSFDTDDFKKVLEFVNSFPDEYDWSAEGDSLPVKLRNGNVLLETANISQIKDVQPFEAMFEAPVTFVGFPTVDGSVGCMLNNGGGFAIPSKAQNKEGAWEFIEFYLNREETMFSWGLPTKKAEMDALIEKELKVEYVTDENGELVLDEEGNPIPVDGNGGFGYDDWEYTYHNTTQEEVDLFLSIIAEAEPAGGVDDEINSMIIEEAAPYFAGQKSVDDVANVIQSRVQLYMNENQ